MKLFYTPNSPYARIARVTALELGLCNRIAMQKVTVRDPKSELLNYMSHLFPFPSLQFQEV